MISGIRFSRLFRNEKTGKIILFLICFAFLAINLTFIAFDFYLLALLPFLFVIGYLYFTALDIVFFLAVFLTPLSFEIVSEDFNVGLSLPSEALFLGILLFFLFKILYERPLTRQMITHPVSIFILLQMSWMLICTITSQIPLVSAKYFIMQLWFVVPVFLFGQLVLFNKKKIYLFFILLTVSISITVIYTTIHHAINLFGAKAGNWVMQPFYNDHTAYGAVLAMMLPVVLGMAFYSRMSRYTRIYLMVASFLMLIGIFLSYSRATWLSLLLALGFYLVLVFKIKFRWLLLAGIAASILLYLNYNNIMMKLEKNKQDSSAHFVEHVQSISNIKTDASNLERINRWKAAMRMFENHAFFGTGPGTYQFLYAPFQKSKDRTIVSTNAGDLGNAHSEYITPLVERGVLGLVFFLAILISVYVTAIRTYNRLRDRELKMIIAVMLSGLFSYLMHGLMNNFLDTENASVVFWGFIAIIVRLSLYSEKGANDTDNIQSQSL